MPEADVIVHSGDISNNGSEEEVLDFLNWMISLPYRYKIFVAGNHDLCLWDAVGIESLPDNLFFLQDKGVTIEGYYFYGLGYDHSEEVIPDDTDVIITHEPPVMILDLSSGTHWGNASLLRRVLDIKPHYHLFGHAHEGYGTTIKDGIVFSNAALLNDQLQMVRRPLLLDL